jgi:hypothetical protein
MSNVWRLLHRRTIIFKIIPGHTDALTPSWHEFKNSVMVEIGVLQWQTFMNSHFHFLIIVESAMLGHEGQIKGQNIGWPHYT